MPITKPKGAPLPDDNHARFLAFVAERGEPKALEIVGVNRATFSRLLAKQSVHQGTAALVRERLARAVAVLPAVPAAVGADGKPFDPMAQFGGSLSAEELADPVFQALLKGIADRRAKLADDRAKDRAAGKRIVHKLAPVQSHASHVRDMAEASGLSEAEIERRLAVLRAASEAKASAKKKAPTSQIAAAIPITRNRPRSARAKRSAASRKKSGSSDADGDGDPPGPNVAPPTQPEAA